MSRCGFSPFWVHLRMSRCLEIKFEQGLANRSENLKQNKIKNKLNKIALGGDKEDKEEKSFSKQKVEIIHHW